MRVYLQSGKIHVIPEAVQARVEAGFAQPGGQPLLVCRDAEGQVVARFDAATTLAFRQGAEPRTTFASSARRCA